MDYRDVFRSALFDELEKIAAARASLTIKKDTTTPRERSGRRSMRVSTMLRKEKEGTLWKRANSTGSSVPYASEDPPGMTGLPAQAPKASGDVPSREDGRANARTVYPRPIELTPSAANMPSESGNK